MLPSDPKDDQEKIASGISGLGGNVRNCIEPYIMAGMTARDSGPFGAGPSPSDTRANHRVIVRVLSEALFQGRAAH